MSETFLYDSEHISFIRLSTRGELVIFSMLVVLCCKKEAEWIELSRDKYKIRFFRQHLD